MSGLVWLTITLGICLIVAVGIIVIAVWRTEPDPPVPLINRWTDVPPEQFKTWHESQRPLR